VTTIHRHGFQIAGLAFALLAGTWVGAICSTARAEVRSSPLEVVALDSDPPASENLPAAMVDGDGAGDAPDSMGFLLAHLAVASAVFMLAGGGAFVIVNRAHLKGAI
jgi:hypothetical protein